MTMRSQVQPIPNVIPANMGQLLFQQDDINMQSTADQQLTKMFTGTRWVPTDVIAVRKTGTFGLSCIGGLYPSAGKGGNAIVGALQTWTGLVLANDIVRAVLAAVISNVVQTSPTCYVSLTTGNLVPLTADFYVFGWILDA